MKSISFPFLAVSLLAGGFLVARTQAQTCTSTEQTTCLSNLSETLVIANEWNRASGGSLSFVADSFTEMILVRSLTASTMNEIAFGDSNDTRTMKDSVLWFQNMGDFLTGGTVRSHDGATTPSGNSMTFFPKGTFIVAVGANMAAAYPLLLSEDLSYNPPAGDFVITIRTDNARYFNVVSNSGVVSNKDLLWIDRRTNTGATPPYSSMSISDQGFGLVFGSPNPSSGLGVSNSDVIVGVGTPGNGKCITLTEGLECACYSSFWDNQVFEPCTYNACNGGLNSTFCNDLQDPLLVDLQSLSAIATPGETVVMTWITTAEVDNAGFHVYRALSGADKELNGGYSVGERLTTVLIPPMGSEFQGATYNFDTGDIPSADGEFWYYLEDLDIYGVRTLHGPIPAVFETVGVVAADVPDWWRFQ